jgi:hypothetical protein
LFDGEVAVCIVSLVDLKVDKLDPLTARGVFIDENALGSMGKY